MQPTPQHCRVTFTETHAGLSVALRGLSFCDHLVGRTAIAIAKPFTKMGLMKKFSLLVVPVALCWLYE